MDKSKKEYGLMYRGLIHFHSNYSYDSLLKIKDIVEFSLKNNLNFLVLTDHETIKGSMALQRYIADKELPIKVILAAEYNTEYGDIIALGISCEIKTMEFNSFVREVKRQKGLLLFPHPYKGHKNVETIVNDMDFIESYNARTDDASNKKALTLARKHNLPIYYATDAHTYKSLPNCIIDFKKQGSLLNSLLNSKITPATKLKSYLYEIYLSQLIKAYKKKDTRLFVVLLFKIIKKIITLKLFKRI